MNGAAAAYFSASASAVAGSISRPPSMQLIAWNASSTLVYRPPESRPS